MCHLDDVQIEMSSNFLLLETAENNGLAVTTTTLIIVLPLSFIMFSK